MNTALIKGKPNNSVASGDTFALSTSGKSMLFPGYRSLLATNFIVSGLGVISVYILITGLPVFIINLFLIYKSSKPAPERRDFGKALN
jgi:hypothetical protein